MTGVLADMPARQQYVGQRGCLFDRTVSVQFVTLTEQLVKGPAACCASAPKCFS